jgi:hypothetical protein
MTVGGYDSFYEGMPQLRWQQVHPAAPPHSDSQADEVFSDRPVEVSSLRR